MSEAEIVGVELEYTRELADGYSLTPPRLPGMWGFVSHDVEFEGNFQMRVLWRPMDDEAREAFVEFLQRTYSEPAVQE